MKYWKQSNRLSPVTHCTVTLERLSFFKYIQSHFFFIGKWLFNDKFVINSFDYWALVRTEPQGTTTGHIYSFAYPITCDVVWDWLMFWCLTTWLLKVSNIRNRLPPGSKQVRERIWQYFGLKWHFSSIYLRAWLPKPRATNKEDGIIAFDWPARSCR